MYKLYEPKNLNCHFIVISPESNVGHLTGTISGLKSQNYPVTAVLDKKASKQEIDKISQLCPTVIGGETITSLLNAGLKSGGKEWNVIIIAGSWVRPTFSKKISYFVESELDVLFPVVNRQSNFIMGTLNGLTIHKKVFDLVGKFDEVNPLETCKMMWLIEAESKGVTFKSIVGAKVC